MLEGVGVYLNRGFVVSFGGVQGSVEGTQKCCSSWYAETSVLALAYERFEGFDFHVMSAESGLDCCS